MNGDIAGGDVDDRDNLSDEVTMSTDKPSTSDTDLQQQQVVESPHDEVQVNGTGMYFSSVVVLSVESILYTFECIGAVCSFCLQLLNLLTQYFKKLALVNLYFKSLL